MVLNSIEKLIEKYDKAETSLAEEAQLRAYFTSDNVAPHLEHYKPMFVYFAQSQTEQYTKDVPLKPKRTKMYQWISVAAVAVLMLSIFIPNWSGGQKSLADYSQEEQQMYLEAKEALAMLSNNFNQGTASLNTLNLASENFNVGLEKASHITEFNQSTNKLLKN
ncbi:MAG: hypothetical protein HRU49_13485 [Winogradskyella sp.]|uniref:hypothetical protein n=1 Tax=Winogradskyella sp. TaxID=1883156 RepID=UPI0025E37218|nr:hypothetical protein [Winogradskyella sp.]NRB84761.1 hypothetical protein [Winogradskyella sp.]